MEQRNYSVDVVRLLAAFGVVMIHAGIFGESDNILNQIVCWFSPRVCVAFFFCVSGYFYIKSINKKGILRKQLVSLLKTYVAWTVVYYLASFVKNVILGKESLWDFVVERIIFFFFHGSYSHFWFLVALIYSVLVSTLFYKWKGKKGLLALAVLSLVLYFVGIMGSSYYQWGKSIPVLNILYGEYSEVFFVFRGIFCIGLPCFMLGYWLEALENVFCDMSTRHFTFLYMLVSGIYIAEIIFLVAITDNTNERMEFFIMEAPMALLVMGLLVRKPMPKWNAWAPVCKNLSCFIYYVHPLIILICVTVADMIKIHIPTLVLYMIAVGGSMLVYVVLLRLSKVIHIVKCWL